MMSPNKDQYEDDEEMNVNNSSNASLLTKAAPPETPEIPFCGCLSVRYYQPYFDVDTNDVYVRLLNSLFYCRRENNFLALIADKPDAYGPFWIATTLVFSVAVTSHISSWISSWMSSKNWEYDFQSIVSSASLIYGFAGIVPTLIYFGLNNVNAKISFVSLLCLYGYSLAVFIPATLICLVPSNAVSWLVLLGAAAASGVFLLRNLARLIANHVPQYLAAILGGIASIQLTFMLLLKIYFFSSV